MNYYYEHLGNGYEFGVGGTQNFQTETSKKI